MYDSTFNNPDDDSEKPGSPTGDPESGDGRAPVPDFRIHQVGYHDYFEKNDIF
jgi:hypothetical protein